MPPKPKSRITIPPFAPGTSQSSTGGTSVYGGKEINPKSPAESDDDVISGRFGLTGSGLSGLRSPDRIDTPDNVLNITTSVGVQSLPPEEMAVLQANLRRAQLLPSTYNPTGTLDDDTRKALSELKRTSSATGMSDLDTLRTRIEQAAMSEAGAYGSDLAGGSSAGGPSKTTNVNKTITEPVFTDPMTARAVVRDALQARLGRAPDADEYHRFRKLLRNSEAGQDVTTQTSTTTSDGQGNTSTVNRVKRSDDTTDPTPDVIADAFTRRGRLGTEANTRMAATGYYGVIDRLIGGS